MPGGGTWEERSKGRGSTRRELGWEWEEPACPLRTLPAQVIDTVPLGEVAEDMFGYFEPLYQVIPDMPRPPDTFLRRVTGQISRMGALKIQSELPQVWAGGWLLCGAGSRSKGPQVCYL